MSTSSSSRPSSYNSLAGRRFRGLPAKERQNQRRQQLLEAGLEVFGKRGFHAAGIRDLCAQAKLTERYFYESFKNREALFAAVYDLAVERMRTAVTDALRRAATGNGPALARVALRATLEMYRADPRLARILLIEVLSIGAGDAPLAESQTYADLIGQLTIGLYPHLDKRRVDVKLVSSGLYGSTLSIITRWTLNGFREPLEHVLDHCLLFYEGIHNELLRRGNARRSSKSKPAPAKRKRPTKPRSARSAAESSKPTRRNVSTAFAGARGPKA